MDIRRSINTRMWSDDWFESLTPSEKLLWIYLLTNTQTNMLGIYEISIKRIQFETGLNRDTIEKALKGFESIKKAFYTNGFIILPNWLKNQAMNPNMVKSAKAIFNCLPNHLNDCLLSNGFESFESLSNGLVMLRKKEKEIEKENEIEKEMEGEKEKAAPAPEFLSEEEKILAYLKTEYPKFFVGKYPLTYEKHEKLKRRFGKNEVKRIYDAMHCKTDYSSKYDDHYKVALNWLRKDNPAL